MRLLGFDISVTKAAVGPTQIPASALGGSSGWLSNILGPVLESFPGAWQRNIVAQPPENILRFSVVYACISYIANDIGKLRIKLMRNAGNDIWEEISSPAYSPVLARPNRYQSRIQFLVQWICCKLLHGNVYAIKERDNRNVVVGLYILDPTRVTPLVADDGSVYYRLKRDLISQITDDETVVPASEIIHDRMLTLWHPLVGVSPLYACGHSAMQGMRIQQNSAKFFENMSRPSGILTAPGSISSEQAQRLKEHWEQNYVGNAIGKVAVLGDGLRYEAMTIPANDAQLIEQLKFTAEDVARCFHVPLYKLGLGPSPHGAMNIGAMNQDYYTQCLQTHIEAIELLLGEELALPDNYGVELDLEGLLRMDPLSVADAQSKGVGAGILAPNEARQKLNLPPVKGGDTPYMQQQNWSLAALDERPNPSEAPVPSTDPTPLPPPPPIDTPAKPEAKDLALLIIKKLAEPAHV